MRKRCVLCLICVAASLDLDARFDFPRSIVASSALQRRAGVETAALHRDAGDGEDTAVRIQRQIQLSGEKTLVDTFLERFIQD